MGPLEDRRRGKNSGRKRSRETAYASRNGDGKERRRYRRTGDGS